MRKDIFPVADAHCDFLFGAMEYGYDINTLKRDQTIHLPYLVGGNVCLQFFAAWIDTTLRTSPLQQAMTMFDCYHRMLADNPTLTPLSADFDPDCGKIATVLAVEGGEACEGSLAMLRMFHRMGVRAMTLTWNENNELAGAAKGRQSKGLSSLGREMVEEMNRIGIALDVAHLSDTGIEDALKISTRPLFASHSNARAVKHTARSLPDELIRAIAEQGGVIGVNFYPPQLCDGKASIEDVVKHIMHIVSIGGVDCCAFGSDFDGMQQYPVDLHNSLDFQKLCRALKQVGFSDEHVYKIAYLNLFNYIKAFV
ncbi:MAG: dipeptidase [Eubacteriales bacterium]|nr:dipeptidase [Eubacteriales bacterium]